MEAVESILIGDQCEILVSEDLPNPLLPPRSGNPVPGWLSSPNPERPPACLPRRFRILEDASATVADPLEVNTVEIPDREEAKTLGVVEDIYRELDRLRMDRHDTIVGVGGGAATDLAGFVAATWLRGVEAVYVPTTLLGAVDAAIGGKTGVNREGKNQVGAFRHPRRVAISIEVLRSLPVHSLWRAWGGPEGRPDRRPAAGGSPGGRRAGRLAHRSGDQGRPGEGGGDGRRLLRDGPPGDSQLRSHSGPRGGDRHRHAARPRGGGGNGGSRAISERRTGFAHHQRQREVIGSLGLPVRSPEVPRPVILELVGKDKKRRGGSLPKMVLLEDFGRPVVVDVSRDDLEAGLAAVGL